MHRKIVSATVALLALVALTGASCQADPDFTCSVGSQDPFGDGTIFWTVGIEPTGSYHLFVNGVLTDERNGPIDDEYDPPIYFLGRANNPEPMGMSVAQTADGPRNYCGSVPAQGPT